MLYVEEDNAEGYIVLLLIWGVFFCSIAFLA